jgi:hypothetical protein
MHITAEAAQSLQFKPCRKTAITRIRRLTKEDHERRGGIIETKEGPISFEVGDYLCRGEEGEFWPVKSEHFKELYEWIGVHNAVVGLYRSKGTREAVQISEPFTVAHNDTEAYQGKPGDYLVRQNGRLRIVDASIFEASYEFLEGQ